MTTPIRPINTLPSHLRLGFAETELGGQVTEPRGGSPGSLAITHPPSVAASSEAPSKLIEVQSLSHAYQMLTQSRPKTKFAGDAKKVDFEAHMRKFESMTNALKLRELEYWLWISISPQRNPPQA
jgi:hypothetical protein